MIGFDKNCLIAPRKFASSDTEKKGKNIKADKGYANNGGKNNNRSNNTKNNTKNNKGNTNSYGNNNSKINNNKNSNKNSNKKGGPNNKNTFGLAVSDKRGSHNTRSKKR